MASGNTSQDCRSPGSSAIRARGNHPGIDAIIEATDDLDEPTRRAVRPSRARAVAAAACDAIARIWLVTRAWLGRRVASPSRLARILEPRRFMRAAITAADRPLALAIAFLPRARRDEAAVAVLACRALRAAGRRSADPAAARDRITRVVGYLTGESEDPPDAGALGAPCGSWPEDATGDPIDALLVARLPALRAALERLPGPAVRRCRDLIERIGEALVLERRDRRRHADRMLGEAVVYAARLVAPSLPTPVAACKAAGRALRFGRDLGGAATAHERDLLLDRALPALAFVPRLLRWLPGAGAGTRAAATLAILTAFPLSPYALTVPLPRRLRRPLGAALAAAWSQRAVNGAADALEAVLHDARRALVERLDGPVVATVPLAVPPDAVVSDAALISLAMELVRVPPELGGAVEQPRAPDPARPAAS